MWIISQIGAREHYAIPRALHRKGELGLLCTDAWIRPGSPWGMLPGTRRLRDRWHPGLAGAEVFAPNLHMIGFEVRQRLRKRHSSEVIIARNTFYQDLVVRHLKRRFPARADSGGEIPTMFSYSCAALELFRFAKSRGWRTVLGQIDPGPEEERLVAAEHERYPTLKNAWQPSPPVYWERWHEEVKLADRILVNSEWSRQCLLKEGIAPEKLEVVPLVYEKEAVGGGRPAAGGGRMEVLFLGQINLRKGVGRLLEAMRLLKDESIALTLAGPAEIDPSAWADLPKVRWVGKVPRSEVGRYYEAADLFVLPTISDGYALTQLEALAHGLPVLASRHCGDAVRHGENGWILEDLEPETIARAIRQAREALPLQAVQMPSFGMGELAQAL